MADHHGHPGHRGQIGISWRYPRHNGIKRTQEQIQHLAYHDALTRCPTVDVPRRLDMSIVRSQRSGKMVALLFLDLDRSKKSTTRWARGGRSSLQKWPPPVVLRPGRDTVSRWGDEFVLCAGPRDTHHAVLTAERYHQSRLPPYNLRATNCFVSCSLGMTFYRPKNARMPNLIKIADLAMYRAKDTGRNNYHLYTEALNAEVMEAVGLERELRQALERRGLCIHPLPAQGAGLFRPGGGRGSLGPLAAQGPDPRSSGQFHAPGRRNSASLCRSGRLVVRESLSPGAAWHRKGFNRPDRGGQPFHRQFIQRRSRGNDGQSWPRRKWTRNAWNWKSRKAP
jgi:diguanylate cyclase (GGDEF)-like protein